MQLQHTGKLAVHRPKNVKQFENNLLKALTMHGSDSDEEDLSDEERQSSNVLLPAANPRLSDVVTGAREGRAARIDKSAAIKYFEVRRASVSNSVGSGSHVPRNDEEQDVSQGQAQMRQEPPSTPGNRVSQKSGTRSPRAATQKSAVRCVIQTAC